MLRMRACVCGCVINARERVACCVLHVALFAPSAYCGVFALTPVRQPSSTSRLLLSSPPCRCCPRPSTHARACARTHTQLLAHTHAHLFPVDAPSAPPCERDSRRRKATSDAKCRSYPEANKQTNKQANKQANKQTKEVQRVCVALARGATAPSILYRLVTPMDTTTCDLAGPLRALTQQGTKSVLGTSWALNTGLGARTERSRGGAAARRC